MPAERDAALADIARLAAMMASGAEVTAAEQPILASIQETEARTMPLVVQVVSAQQAGELAHAPPSSNGWRASSIHRSAGGEEPADRAEPSRCRANPHGRSSFVANTGRGQGGGGSAAFIGSVFFRPKAQANWHRLFMELVSDFSEAAIAERSAPPSPKPASRRASPVGSSW